MLPQGEDVKKRGNLIRPGRTLGYNARGKSQNYLNSRWQGFMAITGILITPRSG